MFYRGFKSKSQVSKALECTVPAGFLSISARGPFKFTRYFVERHPTVVLGPNI